MSAIYKAVSHNSLLVIQNDGIYAGDMHLANIDHDSKQVTLLEELYIIIVHITNLSLIADKLGYDLV